MVQTGRIATVHFVARLPDDGTVVDTTDVDVAFEEGIYDAHRDYRPLEFRVGCGEVLGSIDAAVRDMEAGETRVVSVDPEEAFGPRREERVVEVSRGALESRSDRAADVGRMVRSDAGEVGWITDVTDGEVTVDFNHELTGERLEFELRLLGVDEG